MAAGKLLSGLSCRLASALASCLGSFSPCSGAWVPAWLVGMRSGAIAGDNNVVSPQKVKGGITM